MKKNPHFFNPHFFDWPLKCRLRPDIQAVMLFGLSKGRNICSLVVYFVSRQIETF